MRAVATPSMSEAQSRRHFDEVAHTWVDRYEGVPSFRTRLRVVAGLAGRILGPTGDARVVDLGSGPGVLGTALSAWASLVVCVDTSWAMLRAGAVAQSKVERVLDGVGLNYHSEVLVRVAGSTPALAGATGRRFDLALAVSVLEYQSDTHGLLAGLVELVRPGGFLIFSVPNNRSLVRLIERPVDALAVRAGRLFGIERLKHRSYSLNRPFGSNVPWVEALAATGAVCRQVIPLPLGDSGVRAALRPNLLVVAQVS